VSVSGDVAIVGAHLHALSPSVAPGAAYVFARSGTTWTQEAEILGEGGGFGTAVSLSGDTAAVGAPLVSVGSAEWSGAVYVYARSGTTWPLETQLFALDGQSTDNLGMLVSSSGGTVLAGLRNGPTQSRAYVFVRSGATWVQQAELEMPVAMPGEMTELTSLSLSGGTAILGGNGALVFEDVGCTPEPDGGTPDAGDGMESAFGGCACEAAPGPAAPLGWPLLAALAGIAALRRRRRPG
jgi:MYXO-CTERM domain-containing protein